MRSGRVGKGKVWVAIRKSHGVAFQNCCVCVDTIVEVGTVGLGIVGRANGNTCSVEML